MRSNDRWLGGVCGGIAEYFDFDKNVVRLIYAVLSCVSAGFPGITLYILLWIFMPRRTF